MTSDLTPIWGQDNEPDQIPVFLFRTGPREAVVIREGQGGDGWVDLAMDLLGPVADLLPGLKSGGKATGRTFTMDDASLRKWDALTKHGVDGYSYGVLWGGDGKIAGHVKLKENAGPIVRSAPVTIDPMMAAQLALIVSLKHDIERLEVAIAEVGADVKNIVRFLEVEQESNVLAALDTIHSIHSALRRDGQVVQEDWDRVKGLEQILKAVERQVLSEMSTIADTMAFNNVSGAKAAVNSVKAERLEQLKFLLYHDLWAQEEWIEIMLARKAGSGTLRPTDVEHARKAVEEARLRALDMLRTVEALSDPDATIKGTDAIKLLFTRGLVAGWKYEGDIIRDATQLRGEMLQVAANRQALEPGPLAALELA